MSSEFNPWSRTEAEEWANSYMAERQITPEDEGSKLLFDSFLAGLAKAAEVIAKSPTEREFVKVIEDWKHAWMNVKGTDEVDASNYFERAFGVDANMKYDLARRLVKMKPIEKGKTDGE